MLRRSVRFGTPSAIRSKNGTASCGPGAASGWNWSVSKPSPRSPSTVPSLSETWLTSAAVAGLDGEAVVLRGDEDALRPGDAHGVVGAAVAERELERLQAEREPDELVAEADPVERDAAEQLAHGLDRPVELGRVAGAVADEHGGRLELEHGVGVPGAGDDDGLDARLDEPPHDRALAAEVEHDDARAAADA